MAEMQWQHVGICLSSPSGRSLRPRLLTFNMTCTSNGVPGWTDGAGVSVVWWL